MKKALLLFAALLVASCGEKSSSEGSESASEKPTSPSEEVKPVEEKQQEVKEGVKPEEPVAEAKPELDGVNENDLEYREGFWYLKKSNILYTGKVLGWHDNGQKFKEANYKEGKKHGLELTYHYNNGKRWSEINYKEGKRDGLETWWSKNGQKGMEGEYKDGKKQGVWTEWHDNGTKSFEIKFKDHEVVDGSRKLWNKKGELVNSLGEAYKE
jgi:antitoxin component YwqK of YwqJK toxin-antitoxin module